jgi:sugar-specific transcriptional regulator TrmB
MKEIVTKMTEFGFTIYQSKAYVSLLEAYPATRYEISKKSDVPRSAIYDVIRRLEKSGLVNALPTKPKKYIPLPPDKMLELLETEHKNKLRELRESLDEVQIDIELGSLCWNITGYNNLISKVREMINNAQNQIHLSAWNREIQLVKKELEAALKRGVKVVLFSFTRIPQIGHTFSYGLSEAELKRIWDHKLILIRDLEELVMGEANPHQPRKAAWTYNNAIVWIAANHIVLDITLYGIRAGVDVGEATIEMHPGELEVLGKLLEEKFPENPFPNLNFSQNFYYRD